MCADQSLSLDGAWDFQVAAADADVAAIRTWRSAVVPRPWQAQFADLRHTSGVAWYRRHFTVTPDFLKSPAATAAVLHFGAVDYHATVWVNGQPVGEHAGGYLPFEFEVIAALRAGDNELLVRVVDPTDDRQLYADFPFSEVPHGKQSWYGPLGGIWQSVWLEFRPRLHLARIRLEPSPGTASVGLQVELSGPPPEHYQVVCRLTDPAGNPAGAMVLDQTLIGALRLEAAPEWWSPASPKLYTVTATLQVDGQPDHALRQTCGFRTIEARQGRLYLNGEPIYLRGVLDQGYYPETIYTPPSLDLLETQARAAKALGFNCLRIHIKVEAPAYYAVADRLGLLVWTEVPSWALLTKASAERARQTLAGMVARDGHHPSIIAWTLVNENWGTDLARNAEHRRWLADFYQYAKALDPTRLVIDNSACEGNAHVASDLEDFHYYRAIPDHARAWDNWVAEFARRSPWAWSPDFASKRRPDLPLLVSEFGNWGLPDPEAIQEQGAEPWWFETGSEWEGGIVYPHGVQHRYAEYGLADLFSTYAEFARCAQEHMARSLHYEISTLRLQAAIAGYIVTEFTDVHWECNGLLTMRRQPKHRLDPLLKDLNQDRVVVLRPEQWSGRPGDRLTVQVQTLGVAGLEQAGRIVWQAGTQTGVLPAPGGTIVCGLEQPGVVTLSAQWLADTGAPLAVNQVDLACLSTEPAPVRLRVVDNVALADVLRALGYSVSVGEAAGAAADEIVVAGCYTAALAAHLHAGGWVLLLADPGSAARPVGGQPEAALPVGHIVPRAGTPWQGDWANSLAWIKKQGPLAHLPGGPLLEMEWADLMPEAVLAGLPTWVLHSHSWAGLVVGWVHRPVSLLTVMPYGRGRILVTTFKLNAATLTTAAVAPALLAGILNLL